MLKWKYINSLIQSKECKGSILSARIYADTTANKCKCGDTYSKRIEHSDHAGLMVPKCSKCNTYPPLFHIDADAKDPNGAKIRVKIRHDQNNERLENISQVIFTLQTIQKEIMSGEFDISRYVSKDARESFRFKNYVMEYEKFHEQRLARGEITPKALRDKKSLIKNQLLPYFGNRDLVEINAPMIRLFQRSYVDKFRTRDLALGELKTILRQAKKDGKIKLVPDFDKIPKAKKRQNIISLELVRKTIEATEIELYQDMFTLMTIYPLRPSEIRGLRWKDFDFENNKLHVRGHFSDDVWIDGRKSIAEGVNSTMSYDLIPRVKDIFNKYRGTDRVRSLNLERDWIFKGTGLNHVQDEALADAWRSARKKVGHEHQLYEIRHRCLTEFGKRVKGDIMKMQKFSGHKNANTLMERYIRDDSDLSEFIQ
jgi:integrase